MTTLLNGVFGGLVAGVVTAFFGATRGAAPSMTAASLADRFDGDPGRYRWVALLAHLAYGAVAGGVLVALELHVLDLLSVPVALGPAVLLAVGWSSLLAALTVGFWLLSGVNLDAGRVGGVVGSHLTLGLVLGLWLYVTWVT